MDMDWHFCAALSLNGFIARNEQDAVSWTSREDKRHFREFLSRMDFCILSSKTFSLCHKWLPKEKMVILSRSFKDSDCKVLPYDPVVIQGFFAEKKSKNIGVIGGGFVYQFCLENGFCTKMELTIEPLWFSKGIPFLKFVPDNTKVQLQKISRLNQNSLLLGFDVKRMITP